MNLKLLFPQNFINKYITIVTLTDRDHQQIQTSLFKPIYCYSMAAIDRWIVIFHFTKTFLLLTTAVILIGVYVRLVCEKHPI